MPLEVRLRDEATLDNYFVLPQLQPLIDALQGQLADGGEPSLYLHGPPGSGKSHLLQSCCQLPDEQALYLPLADLRTYAPAEVLQGVERLARICLDDLDAVAGDAAWELELFNLCNRARQSGCRLVFSAAAAPRALGVGLPDLLSRLTWGPVFALPRAADEDKAEILRFRAARRGLGLSPGVASYIVSRAPREMARLLALLDELDRASLAQQRALSIPFVKQALGW
ncbi:MAG: DnaA regulatory inactivator Hda [Halioglobus sp.]|nr:DnaA regulatory inactivator Hda [Halioglobus sp.]